jgi:hypothetical protein
MQISVFNSIYLKVVCCYNKRLWLTTKDIMNNELIYEGQRVHLKSRPGTFTIIKMYSNGFAYSCKVWIARANYQIDNIPFVFTSYRDIHCLAEGGRKYSAHEIDLDAKQLPEYKTLP